MAEPNYPRGAGMGVEGSCSMISDSWNYRSHYIYIYSGKQVILPTRSFMPSVTPLCSERIGKTIQRLSFSCSLPTI